LSIPLCSAWFPRSITRREFLWFHVRHESRAAEAGTLENLRGYLRMFMFDVERVAEESFMIAWDYLDRAGSIDDPDTATVELGNEIVALLGKGENHKIRIANLAIDAYRRKHEEMTH
jgi:hypothetical protein